MIGVLAGVDAVGVGDHPAVLGLAEHLGQPHPGQALGGQQVAQDLPGPDAGQLVDVADQQQMRPGWDRLDQLVGQQHIQHRGLVDHHQVGVQGMVAVKGGVPTRAQLQQPVQGGRLQPGQLRQAFGGPTGRRGQHHLGSLGAGQGDDGAHGVALAAARPAGQHRHPLGQRQPHRRGLLGGQRDAHGAGPASPARPSSPPPATRAAGRWARPAGAAARRPGRPRHDGTAPARSPCPCPPRHPATHAAGSGSATTPSSATSSSRQRPASSASTPSSPVALANQLGLREIAVAVVAGLRQRELQAGLDPLRAVMGNAQARAI